MLYNKHSRRNIYIYKHVDYMYIYIMILYVYTIVCMSYVLT